VLNSRAVSDLALGGSNPAFGTARDVVGIVLWALGLAIETVSDAQKARSSYFFPKKSGGKTLSALLVALQVE
jgi:steroid 5-alpha reductase family enzyme